MGNDTMRYLDLISQHLEEHHAALLVGSGLSRNAEKINPSVPDSPLWDDLADAFKKKLAVGKELENADPLTLAEHVELAYGRAELDKLLLDQIRDADYLPSSVHIKLMRLPWSDIFTTNYDTLLERAGDSLFDKSFSVVTNKGDLLGSFGATRIIKLHGSFPSHRPFIITAEDYRTYPHKFAPFVNTVQQSLLENTMCMIGFSGGDPNFEKWIGWIRDNLGSENAPYMYLLLHRTPSDTRREWLRRRKIITVDLSDAFPGLSPTKTYEMALDYLLKQHHAAKQVRQTWELDGLYSHSEEEKSLSETLDTMRQNRERYPGQLTVPANHLEHFRTVLLHEATAVLSRICADSCTDTAADIEFLYEYDWLRNKVLFPLDTWTIKYYQTILERHRGENTEHSIFVKISLLRAFRENALWEEWDALRADLVNVKEQFTPDQHHRLRWEECLASLFRLQFQELKQKLNVWDVPTNMPLWVLRKAGIWASCGYCEQAYEKISLSIIELRKQMSHTPTTDLFLLSLESAMMNLQGFIAQALRQWNPSGENCDEGKTDEFIDTQRRALHAQQGVEWNDQNAYFVSRLEAPWTPYIPYTETASFDFHVRSYSTSYHEDIDRIEALSFLRFREETGIPFKIKNVTHGVKAAGGAAERISALAPNWAVMTLIQADQNKSVGTVLTRSSLSAWTQQEADQYCRFCMEALLRTEEEFDVNSRFCHNNIFHFSADTLTEVLSEICSKCSEPVLNQLLGLLEKLYNSPRAKCYQKVPILVKRFIASYPVGERTRLVERLAQFSIETTDEPRNPFTWPDPLSLLGGASDQGNITRDEPIETIQHYFDMSRVEKISDGAISHLMHCSSLGLLTEQQRDHLGELLWNGGKPRVPPDYLPAILLDFPHLPKDDVIVHLKDSVLSRIVSEHDTSGLSFGPDRELYEFTWLVIECVNVFSAEEVSKLLAAFDERIRYYLKWYDRQSDLSGDKAEVVSKIYAVTQALWYLTENRENWNPTDQDCNLMLDILDTTSLPELMHYGLIRSWNNVWSMPVSSRVLDDCLRSVCAVCSRHTYGVLNAALFYRDRHLLPVEDCKRGIFLMAQQIAWCVPRNLSDVLDVASSAVAYTPELLTADAIGQILNGLRQLSSQTEITPMDSVQSASEKGNVRIAAVRLARSMKGLEAVCDPEGVLDTWMAISQDPEEFAEIRNAV